MSAFKKCHVLRNGVVSFHLLEDEKGLVLLDAGFIGGIKKLESFLAENGLDPTRVRAVILSHGHLDHVLNVDYLQRKYDILVFAARAEKLRLQGKVSAQSWNRLSGWAEFAGRALLSYQTPRVDHFFDAGEILPFWGRLEVVALPGHTAGHCGFLVRQEKILFAGDLISNYLRRAKLPPRFLNENHALAIQSVLQVAEMDLKGIYLNHASGGSPAENLSDLQGLAKQILTDDLTCWDAL